MAITNFKSYIIITDMNKPKLTTSIVITNVTNIHIKLFAEDIQQLKRGKITKTTTKIVSKRSEVKGIRKKLHNEKCVGARRYEISLRVFNWIAHEWGVELNTRRELSYLKVTMYHFLSYKQNNYWLIENGEGFAVHSTTWPRGAKGDWRVSSWSAISNTRGKIMILFHICC